MTQSLRNGPLRADTRLSAWDADQLSRFCEVAYQMAKRQYGARLNVIVKEEDGRREKILNGLMQETEIIAENLIILALDYGHLKAANLKHKQNVEKKKAVGRTIITERED